jgi:hypothetical protein
MGISENTARITTKLLKIWTYKTSCAPFAASDPVISVTGIFSQFTLANLIPI